MTTPTAYWRAYLGGAINGSQLLVTDATGSGKEDLLFATSGEVIARDPTDDLLWKSALRGVASFAGLADVNGDGILDVIAQSTDHVLIYSSRTGATEWTEPDGEMGTIGVVRVGDVTGDGLADVLVMECGCCGVNSGNAGFFWSFANGFSNAAHLGAIPQTTFYCGSGNSATLIQADTSPQYETLLANDTQFSLLDGSGDILAQTGALGTWESFSQCVTGNIDGEPGDEAICLLSSNDINVPRTITALHYDYSAQPTALNVLWSSTVAPGTGGELQWVDPLQDLDGDGLFELVVSTNDPSNGWLTHVYDALSGVDLITPVPGQTVGGSATMESPTGRVLLTSSGTSVTGWAFSRSPSPSIAAHWTEQNVLLITYPSGALSARESINSQLLATDLNGDGLADVVVQRQATPTTTQLLGFSGVGGSLTQLGALTLPGNSNLLQGWVVPAVTLSTPQVAVVRTDGVLNLLDGTLQPTSAGTPPSEVDIQVGGYYASGAWREFYHAPRVVALGTEPAQSVIVDNSASSLMRLDAASASMAVPPSPTWQVTQTFGPTVVPGLNGNNPAMACLALTEPVTNPPQYRIRVVNADGTLGWDTPLNGNPLTDLAPGNFDGDSVPDFALQLGNASNADLTTLAFSGADGSLLWQTMPMDPGAGGFQSSGLSTGQYGGSGVDDVYFQGNGTFVLSGADGSQVAAGGPVQPYYLPMLYDVEGTGQNNILLAASYWPVTLLSPDLQTTIFATTDGDHAYPYGAIAQCPGTPAALVLVEGSWTNPARLKFTALNGSGAGSFTTVVLAGGALYPNEGAATTAGAFLGQLTSANLESNLTGQNHPTAVLGSSDGWLYGVNPCAGTLDFTSQIGAPVGEAVFGDTDGDGNDEILVTAADGYLYDFKGFSIPAPAYVWDTDPDHGITNHEVSSIVTTSKLSATWAPVNGASSYAVQVVTATGRQPISMPEWQNVGNVTATSLPGLPLTDGTKYLFAVRAVGSNGPSVDTLSSGVTVHFPDGGAEGGVDASADSGSEAGGDASSMPDSSGEGGGDAGPPGNPSAGGGGCGCRVIDSRSEGDGWLALLLALPYAMARYRRNRRTRR